MRHTIEDAQSKAANVAHAMQQPMQAQTDELVELGMLSKEDADQWRRKYLPRFYAKKHRATDTDCMQRLFKSG